MNNNKKIAVIALAMIALALGASAQTQYSSFRWFNVAAGNLKNNAGTDITSGGATVLTYLSSDSTIDFDAGALLSSTYGNDFFYAALGNGLPGRMTTDYMSESIATGTDYSGFYAYAIVLDVSLATFNSTYGGDVANVVAGTYYDVTSMFGTLTDLNTSPVPTADTFVTSNLQTTSQVVPEPATIGLFGLGALSAWIIRRNKLQAREEV